MTDITETKEERAARYEAITQFESRVNRHRDLLREEDSFGLPRALCPQSFD